MLYLPTSFDNCQVFFLLHILLILIIHKDIPVCWGQRFFRVKIEDQNRMYPYLTVGVAHTSSQPSQTDASLKQEQSPNNNPIENLQPQEQHIENQKCNADEEGTCSISKQQTSLKGWF